MSYRRKYQQYRKQQCQGAQLWGVAGGLMWAMLAGYAAAMVVPDPPAASEPAQKPLYLSVVSGKPNIMLMIDNSGSMSTKVVANNKSRMEVAKQAALDMVDSLTPTSGPATVRLGLTSYNSSYGGKMNAELADLTPDYAATVKSKISVFSPGGVTPLATTLSDIGYYFTVGNTTGNLTLHPSGTPTTLPILSVFTKTDNSTILQGYNPPQEKICAVAMC